MPQAMKQGEGLHAARHSVTICFDITIEVPLRHDDRTTGGLIESRHMKKPLLVTSLAILVCSLIAVGWLLANRSATVITAARSPDGTWGVAVVAKPRLTGAYDIVAIIEDADGNVVNKFVIGLESDLKSAKQDFAITFDGSDQARIGDQQQLEKSAYFP